MADQQCPLLKAACMEHRCRWYIQVLGNNPQSGETMNKWGCAVEWLPVLLIENAQQQRQTGAAIESMRNESVKNSHRLAAGLCEVANAAVAGRPAELKDVLPVLPALEQKRN